MPSDDLPQSGTRSIAYKAYELSSSLKRSSLLTPSTSALNTAPTRRHSRRMRRATAPNTAPPLLLLPRAPRPTAPARAAPCWAARMSWSVQQSSLCLEVRLSRTLRPAACKCSPRRPRASPQERLSRTLRPQISSSCMSGYAGRMQRSYTLPTSSHPRLPSQLAWSRCSPLITSARLSLPLMASHYP